MTYSGWFICDDMVILGIRETETLLNRTKRGIPKGALEFSSEHEAETELHVMREFGLWPLFAPTARVERITWSR